MSPVILDGATGTLLRARGVTFAGTSVAANESAPDDVAAVARDYVRAGAEVITANTFGDVADAVRAFGLARAGVVAAGAPTTRVAASVGPFPASARELEVLRVVAPDLVLVETQVALRDALVLVAGAREAMPHVPIWAGVVVSADGRLPDGTTALDAARALADAGALPGVSCTPVHVAVDVGRTVADALGAPLWIKANAGLPRNGRWPETPESFARALDGSGAFLHAVGGCCGTTPATITALVATLRRRSPHAPGDPDGTDRQDRAGTS
ncbi:MAG: homocysteine S-methyltransferase family protein [bacterium]